MTYTISIGSNVQGKAHLAFARRRLAERFPDVRFSTVEDTTPLFFRNRDLFSNQVARFTSDSPEGEVVAFLKAIEGEAGRMPEDKAREIVKLDLDLLACDTRVCRPEDMARDYIARGLQELENMD